ncbi:BlaI/MecI/CopY family transcriptional regulator [Planctobacterium marinum]|uniref:BlaI/MecI/CopY family transcriptional regulator n=1 Tax=Planctobacterium marinum TaxID=1631968 RepID=UPI001E48AA0A|nr:BlaI/MecI/CopY family transcriptional regulator [Planctobacterium marinum]MCC2608074.1 BlaI/MecI/CopY family transcriptional regulator [Planctobacterium marinum]
MTRGKFKGVPTSAELQLLRVLWEIEPTTVREVHEKVNKHNKVGYTTVLKMLQIMHEKGLVERDESSRAHIYKAIYSEEQTQSSMVKDMLNKAFGGSKSNLVMRALGKSPSAQELAEIRALLDSLEKDA